MKLLIADDNILVRHAVQCTLTEAGHDTEEAADGQAVIDSCRLDWPDVLILDLMMPRVTGYEVLRWLSAEDPERRVKVIILSAFVVGADSFDHHPHVVGVLQKPLYTRQLLDLVAQVEHADPTPDPSAQVRLAV